MKLYLSAQFDGSEMQKKVYDILTDLGVIVFTAQQSISKEPLSFDKLDGLVILAGKKNQEAGYLSALAISQRRPILYLLKKGSLIPDEVRFIKDNKQVAKYLIIKFYEDDKVKNRLAEFIDLLESGNTNWDEPSIKFTWRITPRIERYLQWKISNSNKTKAQWLREFIIKEVINKDDRYNQFLKDF